jgi:hypothetical protein
MRQVACSKKSWEVVSLLTTCRKGKQGGDERERRTGEGGLSQLSLLIFRFFFMKYLENCLFNLRTVSSFKIIASRSSKLGPMLIGFVKLFYYTYRTTTSVLGVYSGCTWVLTHLYSRFLHILYLLFQHSFTMLYLKFHYGCTSVYLEFRTAVLLVFVEFHCGSTKCTYSFNTTILFGGCTLIYLEFLI